MEEKKKKKKDNKKKESIFKKIKKYFIGVKKEIGRIRWTTPKDLLKYSILTILFVAFLCVYFYLIEVLVALLRSLV